MRHVLDHLLWAVPDLDDGMRQVAAATGVEAALGGSHPGFGTRNALLSLGDGVYLEIIAPDPDQPLAGTRGEQLAALEAPTLLTFAVRTDSMSDLPALVAAAGLRTPGPVAMSRRHPSGHLLEWQVLRLEGHRYDDLMPFFIDWGQTDHPSGNTPTGCLLTGFEVRHPNAEELAQRYRTLAIEVPVIPGPAAGLQATFATPNGPLQLGGR